MKFKTYRIISSRLVFGATTILFLLQSFCSSESTNGGIDSLPNITIAFLSSFKFGGGMGKLIAGAVPIAVQAVNNREDLLPGYKLRFMVGDYGNPGTYMAIRKMTQMKENGAVAFIGPDHSCDTEALVAAAWNIPMISFKCVDQKVSNKKKYPTFARTLPTSSKVSKSVIALLRNYSWSNIVLVVADNPSDKQVEEALKKLAKEYKETFKLTIASTYNISGDYITKYKDSLRDIIEKSYKRTRVYVMLADKYALVDFASIMQERRLLDSGDYVIISVEEEEAYNPDKPMQFIRKEIDAALEQKLDTAPFRSVLMLTPSGPINPNYSAFQDQVIYYSSKEPFNVPFHDEIKVSTPTYAGFVYDAVMIYAKALTEVLNNSGSILDGETIINHTLSSGYDSILGFSVRIDENGDAEGNYTLLALKDDLESKNDKSMQPVGFFIHQGNEGLPSLNLVRSIDWISGSPPANEPKCGFTNEHCAYRPDWKLIVICSVCVIVVIVAGFFALRHYRYEQKLACLLWKVDLKDVLVLRTNSESTLQNVKSRKQLLGLEVSCFSPLSNPSVRTVSKTGFYKGNIVYIKPVYKRNIDLTRSLRKEMIKIREMRHENINPFIGACVDPPNICIITLYCARGSLEDVLQNEDLDLDTMFVASLVADLIKGMIYVHDSEIISHGNLKSSNCLVDSRWVLQITDFGLHEFKAGQDLPPSEEAKYQRGLLWRAPELLRISNPLPRGSQKGDIFSFGIILHEIIARQGPWGPKPLPVKCIIDKVMNPQNHSWKLYRPITQGLDCADYVVRCMEECWEEDPESRPDFRFINVKLRQMQAGLKSNIFDNMIAIMEKYAYNLEGLVQERTTQLMEEKKKTENLLLRMLPKPVAEQLKRGEQVEAESFDSVTIYFSDIVGFTALSAVITPLEVVDLLNDLYTCFDSIIGNYDVYKVETIGDAYMVVSGLPIRNGHKHAEEIASMALHLLKAIQNFELRHRPGERLKLRIGIHSGPCVAGVVGLKMPRYCLFGDTVNTASRMESTGEALKIHVSQDCKTILDTFNNYILEERGMTQVKGKGMMRTYWLKNKKPEPEKHPLTLVHPELYNCVSEETPRRNTDSNLEVKYPHGINPHQLCPGYIDSTPYPELRLLLYDEKNSSKKKCSSDASGHNYNSCLSLFQECKKNIIKELWKDGRVPCSGYRSAPVISLREDYPSCDCLL